MKEGTILDSKGQLVALVVEGSPDRREILGLDLRRYWAPLLIESGEWEVPSGSSAPPVDENFLTALEQLPPCAGGALGFDRLVMLAAGATDITEVLWAQVD